MTEILEIALVSTYTTGLARLLNGYETQTIRIPDPLKYVDLNISEERRIYLYIIENFTDRADYYLPERIFPKAAGLLLLFDAAEGIPADTLQACQNRYGTPVFLLAENNDADQPENSRDWILFDPAEDQVLEKVSRDLLLRLKVEHQNSGNTESNQPVTEI